MRGSGFTHLDFAVAVLKVESVPMPICTSKTGDTQVLVRHDSAAQAKTVDTQVLVRHSAACLAPWPTSPSHPSTAPHLPAAGAEAAADAADVAYSVFMAILKFLMFGGVLVTVATALVRA